MKLLIAWKGIFVGYQICTVCRWYIYQREDTGRKAAPIIPRTSCHFFWKINSGLAEILNFWLYAQKLWPSLYSFSVWLDINSDLFQYVQYQNPLSNNTFWSFGNIGSLITGLNVKPEIIKFLEESIGGNLCDLRVSKDFLDKTRKAQPIEEKNCLYSTKIKNYCSSKDTVTVMKTQVTN